MKTSPNYNTVRKCLLQPLHELIQTCETRRDCKAVDDLTWLETGVERVLSQEVSGRAFVQLLIDVGKSFLTRSNFFAALKSKRRLKLSREINTALLKKIKEGCTSDPFEKHSFLDSFDIYAGDGHYHASSTHDTKKDGKKIPVQHFYSLNMRTHGLSHLALADTSGTRKREHDMRCLKRLTIDNLRVGALKGRKVLHVWDRAAINFEQWYNWKQGSGIYFISREKENMRLIKCGEATYDKSDPINNGVLKDEFVGSANGFPMRRVTFKTPDTGEVYVFLTSLTSSEVPPGMIAFLYKCRWDIEKTFDEFKNKLIEKKSWGSTEEAKSAQATFLCITHNLMLILERTIEKDEGIKNDFEVERRQKRIAACQKTGVIHQRGMPSLWVEALRLSQRGVKFIRWLRNNLFLQTPWDVALCSLRRIYAMK